MTDEIRSRGATHHVLRPDAALVGIVCLLVAALTACSSHQAEILNQREYAPYRSPGSATIAGQVSLTLQSGATLYGAACPVRLTPVTTTSTRYMQDVVRAGGTKPWQEDADAVWWLSTADDAGRFRFEEVPAGSYYLTCLVAWRSPDSGDARQRILWAETTVAPRESVMVDVSR